LPPSAFRIHNRRVGNRLTEDDQRRELALMVEVAREVRG
jgi:hypothetical protein